MAKSKPSPQDDDLEITLTTPSDGSGAAPFVRIRVEADVRKQMVDYAHTDTSRELGGILIGTLHDGAEPQVVIEAVIIARYTEEHQASITFTHATWQDVHAIKDRAYPDRKIVGWFHTHPGFGVFLSRYDLHIHENFFDLPWQVAYVVDPIANTEGFFRWEHGAVRRTAEYQVIGEVVPAVTPAPVTTPAPVATPGVRRYRPLLDPRNYAVVALTALSVYLAFFRPPLTRVETRTETVTQVREVPAPSTPAPPQPAGPEHWPVYTVQPGDSLWRIAERCYGDGKYARLIMEANALHSATITAGMVLKVPGGANSD